MPDTLFLSAPSRLHFGLMNFGGESARQFGGVGVMIDRPGVELRFRPADNFYASGPLEQRIRHFAKRWSEFHLQALPRREVKVVSAPREHTGLGVGTQLGMSVAAGLSALAGLPQQTPLELAASVGRGFRSAVGVYGFLLGGLIAERGKLPGEPVSPLDCHLSLPSEWRAILVCPRDTAGLANEDEVNAFAQLPPVPESVTLALTRIARERLLPAAARGDFVPFAEAVYDYGKLSGECFAALQGGPYNGPRLTAIVARLRSLGVVGVGQSSWGPTIFGFAESEQAASRIANELMSSTEAADCDIVVSGISQRGAKIETRSGSEEAAL
jgi:beta-RFAP synthase